MTALSTPSVKSELPRSYVPADWEDKIRARWDEARAFHADPVKTQAEGQTPFCIVIPPPNVTAALHLGHAFNNTLQDILTRYHRMLHGREATLWMPGTDHAGIATQAVVEKRLLLQGIKRRELGREKFIEKVQAWKDEYEATILDQLKSMGCSCDFERTRFTMDEVCAKAVREAFFRLFKDGLIYRGKRLVNWDPVSQTALADDEVEMEEVQGFMYYLRYPIDGSPSEFVTVATTRPETMLGDVAVAMNPKDPRAAQFVGKKVRLPIVDRVVPIIADEYVVRPAEFGGDENDAKAKIATGFLKVTPAHDDNDYLIGQRHNLPIINVFAPDASISDKHGWTDVSAEAKALLGLAREDTREKVVKWFESHGLLEAKKPYTHSVGHSYRSHVPIEPYLSDQWYVKVTDDRMRGEALRAMSQREGEASPQRAGSSPSPTTAARRSTPAGAADGDGTLTFYPPRYAKTFQSWHENIRDWCISRQIWWGHRIPVWTKRFGTWKQFLGEGPGDDQNAVSDAINFLDDPEDVLSYRLCSAANPSVDLRTKGVGEPNYSLATFEKSVSSCDDLVCVICVRPGARGIIKGKEWDIEQWLQANGFEQDADVLDTWFSSALWPISTMGWPDPEAFSSEIPEGSALLNTFNPSSVLCTAREIITLWVSRMVMFNRYLRDGLLPFRDVYIHAMIQDGHGQKMSKSLGNGVDPRDIIHSHGADALRFIMASIATQTQDVRLPVDMVCPHCSETFHPKEITSPAGYRVADATQTCPKCHKKMVSGYGAATGLAMPTDAVPQARNSSSKFDEGRNLATKLWQVTAGFALPNLAAGAGKARGLPPSDPGELPLVDRWILARLHRTLRAIEDAISEYRFKEYADTMYDLVRRDFCDWYVEAIKPTIKTDPRQWHVLSAVLNAMMRLLHPIMPFITEALWPQVSACDARLEGVKLDAGELLATASWPGTSDSLDDASAIATFERVQALINAIRNIRSERQVPPKKKIHLAAPPSTIALIKQAGGVVQSLALLDGVEEVKPGAARPAASIPFAFEGGEVLVSGLVDALDLDAERQRLTKLIAEKEKAVAGFRGRLANEGYISKAPPEKVEETRQVLAQAQADLDAARQALQSLSG